MLVSIVGLALAIILLRIVFSLWFPSRTISLHVLLGDSVSTERSSPIEDADWPEAGTPVLVPDSVAQRIPHPIPRHAVMLIDMICLDRWPTAPLDATPRDKDPRLFSAPSFSAGEADLARLPSRTILYDVLVGTDGRAHDVRVMTPAPGLEAATRSVLGRCRFRPAILGHAPVAVRAVVSVKYSLW